MRMLFFSKTLLVFFSFAMNIFAADLSPPRQGIIVEAAPRKLVNIIHDLRNIALSMAPMKTLNRGELIEIVDGKIQLSVGNANKVSKPLQSLSRTLKNQLSPGSVGREPTLKFGEEAATRLENLYLELKVVIQNDPLAVAQLLKCKFEVVADLLSKLSVDYKLMTQGWHALRGTYTDKKIDIQTINRLFTIEGRMVKVSGELSALFSALIKEMELLEKTAALHPKRSPLGPLTIKTILGRDSELVALSLDTINLYILKDTIKRLNSCDYFWDDKLLKASAPFQDSETGQINNIKDIKEFYEYMINKFPKNTRDSLSPNKIARLSEVLLSFASIVSSEISYADLSNSLASNNNLDELSSWMFRISNKHAFFQFNINKETNTLHLVNLFPAEYINLNDSQSDDCLPLRRYFLITQSFAIDLTMLREREREMTKEEIVEQCVIAQYDFSDRYFSEKEAILVHAPWAIK